MGKLTERGEIVAAGGAQLADVNGDDTLTRPDARDVSSDVEGERDQGQDEAPAPDPASDDEGAPKVVAVVETADDVDIAARETR